MHYGIVNMKRFFPIGSGFATFGSDTVAKYYSKLYIKYGFSQIYGLSEENSQYVNDGSWGEMFGQFGFLGTVIFVLIIVLVFVNLFKKTSNKYERSGIIFIEAILVIGSSGTKTFFTLLYSRHLLF